MNFSEFARFPGAYHLNGPFAKCMGSENLFGQWIDFVNQIGPCVDKTPPGKVVEGPPRVIFEEDEDTALFALMLALVALLSNIFFCLFFCARLEYESIEFDAGDHLSDDDEGPTFLGMLASSWRRATARWSPKGALDRITSRFEGASRDEFGDLSHSVVPSRPAF
mmetsp:Transcript_25143/g.46092  ORF Transcript_25143/g.46092 Transcript_25143/m.46092 type:complete len:165 (+) Transcript_25143:101-595(+)